MFIQWAWNFNPEILTPTDLDWFYEFILKTHVEERKKEADPNAPAVIVHTAGQTKTAPVDNAVIENGEKGKV